jgi:hypothetical protein
MQSFDVDFFGLDDLHRDLRVKEKKKKKKKKKKNKKKKKDKERVRISIAYRPPSDVLLVCPRCVELAQPGPEERLDCDDTPERLLLVLQGEARGRQVLQHQERRDRRKNGNTTTLQTTH